MGINTWVVGLITIFLGLHATYAFLSLDKPRGPANLPWVPIQVGKTRSFHSQTRDASMFTERQRRVAIIGANHCGVGMVPPGQKHFSNGVMETFLTGICAVVPSVKPPTPPTPPTPPPVTTGWDNSLDGMSAGNNDYTTVIDGNRTGSGTIDGNPRSTFTKPAIVVDATPSFFDTIFDGNGWNFSFFLDGGNAF